MVFFRRITVLAALGLISVRSNAPSVRDELDKLPVDIRDVIEDVMETKGYSDAMMLIDAMSNTLDEQIEKETGIDRERLEDMNKSFSSLKEGLDKKRTDDTVAFAMEEKTEDSDLALAFAIGDDQNERYFHDFRPEESVGFGKEITEVDADFADAFADAFADTFEAEESENVVEEDEKHESNENKEEMMDMDAAIEGIPDANIRNDIKDNVDRNEFDEAEEKLKKYVSSYITDLPASDKEEAVRNEDDIMSYITEGFNKKRNEVAAFAMEEKTEESTFALAFAAGENTKERDFYPEESVGFEQEIMGGISLEKEIDNALEEIAMNQEKIAEALKAMGGNL